MAVSAGACLVAADLVEGGNMWKEVLGNRFVAHYLLEEGQVLVLSFVDDEAFSIIPKKVKKKDNLLVVTEKEVIDGADVFPIEWLTIKTTGKCIEGTDILQNVKIDLHELREQLEYEVRSKLIDLRQHLFFENSKSRNTAYIRDGVKTLVPILRALVGLKDKQPEEDLQQLIKQVEMLWKIESDVVIEAKNTNRRNVLLHAQELRHWLKQVANVVNDVQIE